MNAKRKPDEDELPEDKQTSGLYRIVVFHADQSVVWNHTQKHYLTLHDSALIRNSLVMDKSPAFSTDKTLKVHVLEQETGNGSVSHVLCGAFELKLPSKLYSETLRLRGKVELLQSTCEYDVLLAATMDEKAVKVVCVRVDVPKKRAIKIQKLV